MTNHLDLRSRVHPLDPNDLVAMVDKYREIRRRVWADATRGPGTSTDDHEANQRTLRTAITDACGSARLELYNGTGEAAAGLLWRHAWSKIRFAGFKAQRARDEIESLIEPPGSFDDYQMFASPDWTVIGTPAGKDFDRASSGTMAKTFLQKSGVYADRHVVANVSKLKKTVRLARAFANFIDQKRPNTQVIKFFTGGEQSAPWLAFDHLETIGYTGPLTRLHLLMDLGFSFIKPDIVLSSLFLKWGWLHLANPELPSLTKRDLDGKGQYRSKYSYGQPRMFVPAIHIARQIADSVRQDDLRKDIGWCTGNPLRELDLFLVKSGQKPERQFGIVTQIEPLESISQQGRANAYYRQPEPTVPKKPVHVTSKPAALPSLNANLGRVRGRLERWRQDLKAQNPDWDVGEVILRPSHARVVIKLSEIFELRLVARPTSKNKQVRLNFNPASSAALTTFDRIAALLQAGKHLDRDKLKDAENPSRYFNLKEPRHTATERDGIPDVERVEEAIGHFKSLIA